MLIAAFMTVGRVRVIDWLGIGEKSMRSGLDETCLALYSQEWALKTRADKLRLLYHQSFPAVFISMVNALLLWAILSPHLDNMLALGWLGAIFSVSFVRLILYMGYRRIEDRNTSFIIWEKSYFMVLVISSLVWGLGCVWMMINVSFSHQVVIYCFLIGMAGGAISVYSAVQPLVLAIVAALVVPAILWLLLQDNATSLILGMSGTLFFLSAIRATRILADALDRSFSLNHQLLEAKQRAELLARTDSLTGLYNRGYFTELASSQAKLCQRHDYPVSLILLDVDNFKKINDCLGHPCGDLALCHLSAILIKSIRSSDVCGRIGGEEFAIFLPNADLNEASIIAERIRYTVESSPVQTEGKAFGMTVSLGIATGNIGLEGLLKMADKAMYRAKEAGRNQVCDDTSPVGPAW